MRRNSSPLELEITAAKIRRNVLDICRQRGGYAAQGVALADIAATLYFDELRPDGEGWFKDRFVLSNGHDAIMTYAALAETGHYSLDDLRRINADGSWVDQSPIEGQLGFEMTAGSLGQGPSQSAGLAWALRQQGSDARVYCLFSDGELQEGNTWEGAMFAGHQRLDNLCYIVDNNDMQASGHAADVMGVEPVDAKFEAFGFAARRISGTDVQELMDTFGAARATKDKPFVMICDTRLWDGIDCLQKALPMAHYTAKGAVDWDAGLADINAALAELETQHER
ncbi:Transketolase [Candidatus Rhodobacter oscarellae]|uniref:Transketolase n=1 Tax=Candidatus Rhodobacter oscarellae TaxID=1675527 RepID=A0A0J9E8M4_9RHOB|nr:1-deoxy-D-xylulose-5-phosphate synthase N-terminal domain-containing protein [Candidatus Rhodobacter lobularis]KMW59120.1 Transketolase [Candidatus Rhodobacter lobularis]